MNPTMSKSEDHQKPTTLDESMYPHDFTDDEVALHHLGKKIPPTDCNTMKKRDSGDVEPSSPTKRRAILKPKPPPPLQRIRPENSSYPSREGGFDPTSLAWLQRIEEIATIWLNKLVQQQHLYRPYHDSLSQEKQRIIDFCTRSLQQILSEGGFRSYTTPSHPPELYSRPLPPLQDLPCMVVTLKYWYSTLLSRCQHQTAVAMLPHRVLAPQQLSQISIQEYIHACENEVKRWLQNFAEVETTTKNKPPTDSFTDASNVNSTYVDVWMQQLQKKTVPTYSPVKPKSAVASITHAETSKVDRRIPSPTDVMMFDPVVAPTLTPEDDSNQEGHEDTKPAASKSAPHSNFTNATNRASSPVGRKYQPQNINNISLEKANDMRGLILSLYHANKCPFSSDRDDSRCCPVSKGCRIVKDLWQHITSRSNRRCCVQNTCSFSRLAMIAEEALAHFGHCKKRTCFICGPVLAQMPKVKRDIAAAVKAYQSQTTAVEEAVLQVVNDITYDDVEDHPTDAAKDITKHHGMDNETDATIQPMITQSSSDVSTYRAAV